MKFLKTADTNELEIALTKKLQDVILKNEKVIWIVTGGLNISVAVKVMNGLKETTLTNLTILLTDERFGEPGHPDSNYYQLHQAGFKTNGAVFKDLLSGKSLEETVKNGSIEAENIFSNADTVIALFGMGADGHIAGILPNSPAAVSDEKWMIGYEWTDYTRFTLTPFALSHIDVAYLSVYGEGRLPHLIDLRDTMSPFVKQPAQLLKHVPEVYVYNNQIEGDI